jgi:hypothetical protein
MIDYNETFKNTQSVLQEGSAITTSDRYKHITTLDIIKKLAELNWIPNRTMEVKARKNIGFQKHMVTLRNPDVQFEVGNRIPEVLLVNSHDGKISHRVRFGIFEVICSNGLIVAKEEFPELRILHRGIEMTEVENGVYEYVKNLPTITGKIEEYLNIKVDKEVKYEFGKNALAIRFGSYENSPLESLQVIQPRRYVDNEDNLWKLFNVVQENIVRPIHHAQGGTNRRVKAINSIDKTVDINIRLWALMESFAERLR